KPAKRRAKKRLEIQLDLRYKMTAEGSPVAAGTGKTLNMCSSGIAFATDQPMQAGAFVELSINWPVLLDDSCPMRLNVFGRILRADGREAACSIDKYEFRTAPRTFQQTSAPRNDNMLQRWADGVRKGIMKESLAGA